MGVVCRGAVLHICTIGSIRIAKYQFFVSSVSRISELNATSVRPWYLTLNLWYLTLNLKVCVTLNVKVTQVGKHAHLAPGIATLVDIAVNKINSKTLYIPQDLTVTVVSEHEQDHLEFVVDQLEKCGINAQAFSAEQEWSLEQNVSTWKRTNIENSEQDDGGVPGPQRGRKGFEEAAILHLEHHRNHGRELLAFTQSCTRHYADSLKIRG